MSATINVFLIYSYEDGTGLLQLLRHLDPLKKVSKIHFWYDDPIYPDKEWSPQIVSRFEDADVYLLLVSNNFMHSKFIEQVEFKMIVDKYKAGKSKVIPIVLENCPWDIDFEAEEYTFNFNQLHVLPEADKPIADWASVDKAFEISAAHISKVIDSLNPVGFKKAPKAAARAVEPTALEDQKALSFSEEKKAEEKVKEEKRIQEAATAQKRAVELEQEQKLKEAKEANIKVEEEKRRRVEIENEKRIQEEEWLQERMGANPEIQMAAKPAPREAKGANKEEPTKVSRNRILVAMGSVAAAIVLIFLLYKRSDNGARELNQQPEQESVVTNGVNNEKKTFDEKSAKSTTLSSGASLSKLSVGDRFQKGIVFEVGKNGENGIMAYNEDFGPMAWKEAMVIHEQLGEGWRLPTITELKTIYKTIGPGADNLGGFTRELYWSATPYDENQARLARFSDGNTSYHYNSRGNHRQFLVRAVRDINQY